MAGRSLQLRQNNTSVLGSGPMPLSASQLRHLLNEKRAAFADFDQVSYELLQAYRASWKEFGCLPLELQKAQLVGAPKPMGAYPLESADADAKGIVRFYGSAAAPRPWTNRQESLVWAKEILGGVTTFAVDGSQIFPSKDISIPIALVQVGWFENAHQHSGTYDKDIRLELLTPEDLRSSETDLPQERRVNIRRFELEIERLVEYIETCPNPDQCLVFFDGALVVTFAQVFEAEGRIPYVRAMLKLIKASEHHRVPLVGYIDTSYAHDLTTLLHHGYELPPTERIHDAQVLNPLMQWGDRTPFYRCDRGGILEDYGEFGNRIGFIYLKTTREGYPVRLEMPLWLWEAGQLDVLLNRVRAEVVVGGGYPYAIETADQTAVIQNQDRQLFFRILQEWAEQEAIQLRFSRKMVSKSRRR